MCVQWKRIGLRNLSPPNILCLAILEYQFIQTLAFLPQTFTSGEFQKQMQMRFSQARAAPGGQRIIFVFALVTSHSCTWAAVPIFKTESKCRKKVSQSLSTVCDGPFPARQVLGSQSSVMSGMWQRNVSKF